MKLKHLFYEDCEEENHNNWKCLLDELVFDGEALEYYQDKGIITSIGDWVEKTEHESWYFCAKIFRFEPSGGYFWIYENLKGEDGGYSGTEDWSWIDLGKGTIQDWIDAVKDKEAMIEELP